MGAIADDYRYYHSLVISCYRHRARSYLHQALVQEQIGNWQHSLFPIPLFRVSLYFVV